jgi:hypothetical protein
MVFEAVRELNGLTNPIGIFAGRATVVPLCDGRVMSSTVTTFRAGADRVAGSVRTALTTFGAPSYSCAMAGS